MGDRMGRLDHLSALRTGDGIASAVFRRMEMTSFLSPKQVPQMADPAAVIAATDDPALLLSALVRARTRHSTGELR